jgi:hypothetical protein
MRVTLLLSAFSAVGMAILLGAASHSQEVRGQAKELVALVESKSLSAKITFECIAFAA